MIAKDKVTEFSCTAEYFCIFLMPESKMFVQNMEKTSKTSSLLKVVKKITKCSSSYKLASIVFSSSLHCFKRSSAALTIISFIFRECFIRLIMSSFVIGKVEILIRWAIFAVVFVLQHGEVGLIAGLSYVVVLKGFENSAAWFVCVGTVVEATFL